MIRFAASIQWLPTFASLTPVRASSAHDQQSRLMKPQSPVPPLALEFMMKIGHRYSVPIFQNLNRPHLVGTGFFVTTSNFSYLVTASHVLVETESRLLRDRGVDPFLFFYVGPNRTMAVFGDHVATAAPKAGFDLYDLGVVQLPLAIEWESEMAPLSFSLRTVPRAHLPLPTLHAIAGFPSTKLKPNFAEGYFDTQLVGLFEAPESRERCLALGYWPEHHIVLPFTQRRQHKFTDGVRAHPDPKGMSGSPIWNLYSDGGVVRPVLGGVATTHRRRDRVVVGIRIGHALRMIDQLEEEANSTTAQTRIARAKT
jgi:hypothetical protein